MTSEAIHRQQRALRSGPPRITRGARVRDVVVTTTLAAVAAGALVTGAVASSEDPAPPTWNVREHEARRSLAQGQEQEQREWSRNPREHEGHRPAQEVPQAGRAAIAVTCAEALAQAWEDLGHFSDGMETWMLTTPTCSLPG